MIDLNKGLFITFEGSDHSGKSTQILLLKQSLEELGFDVVITREPGGTRVSEEIRKIIIDPKFSEMTPRSETLLYEAARSQVVSEVIKPALADGKVVLCDRYTDSTIAYQGYGRGLGKQAIDVVNQWATDGLEPDFTFFFTLPREEAKARKEETGEELDRLELASEDFYAKVESGYQNLLAAHPARIVRVNASKSKEDVHAFLIRALEARFEVTEKASQDVAAQELIDELKEDK